MKGRRVPEGIDSLTVAIFDRLPAARQEQVRTWLQELWNLDRSHLGLKPIAYPPAPTTADADQALFATGPVAAVLARTAELKAAGERGPGHRDVEAFIARTDVPTDAALTVAAGYNDHSRTLLRLRPFDREFYVHRLQQAPGWFDDVLDAGCDVDWVLEAMARYHDRIGPGGSGLISLREVVKSDGLLAKLGPAALRLPWPVLATLTGLDADTDAAVADALAEAAAQPGSDVLLPLLADGADGPLPALVAAVGGALAA